MAPATLLSCLDALVTGRDVTAAAAAAAPADVESFIKTSVLKSYLRPLRGVLRTLVCALRMIASNVGSSRLGGARTTLFRLLFLTLTSPPCCGGDGCDVTQSTAGSSSSTLVRRFSLALSFAVTSLRGCLRDDALPGRLLLVLVLATVPVPVLVLSDSTLAASASLAALPVRCEVVPAVVPVVTFAYVPAAVLVLLLFNATAACFASRLSVDALFSLPLIVRGDSDLTTPLFSILSGGNGVMSTSAVAAAVSVRVAARALPAVAPPSGGKRDLWLKAIGWPLLEAGSRCSRAVRLAARPEAGPDAGGRGTSGFLTFGCKHEIRNVRVSSLVAF